MIEMLFQLGFALACAIAAVSLVFWALVILPDWVRRRRAAKKAAKTAKRDSSVHDMFMQFASPEQRRQEQERRQAEAEADT